MEWSADLIHWEPVADASGATLSLGKVASVRTGEGTMTIVTPAEVPARGFFRLRTKE